MPTVLYKQQTTNGRSKSLSDIVQRQEPRRHEHDPATKYRLYDARGIYLCTVCDECEKEQRAKYRADVLSDPNYWHDEPIDAE